jgi:hypothetical protein
VLIRENPRLDYLDRMKASEITMPPSDLRKDSLRSFASSRLCVRLRPADYGKDSSRSFHIRLNMPRGDKLCRF